MLSVLAISLNIFALLVAFLAFWGYVRVKETANRIAADTATATINGYLDGKEIQEQLRAIIERKVAENADKLYGDLYDFPIAYADAAEQNPAGQPAVAESYPDRDQRDSLGEEETDTHDPE